MNVFAEDYSIQHKIVHRKKLLSPDSRERRQNGRFRLFDGNAVLSPEKELRAAVGMNRLLPY
ncbi:MAG: hypothetical protein IJI26_14955 [Clostridia bacterium]|nr:hypothetical protein [Clostridia bacterium]